MFFSYMFHTICILIWYQNILSFDAIFFLTFKNLLSTIKSIYHHFSYDPMSHSFLLKYFQDFARLLIEDVNECDWLSILTFSNDVTTVINRLKMTPANKVSHFCRACRDRIERPMITAIENGQNFTSFFSPQRYN